MSFHNAFNRAKFTLYVPVYDFVGRWFMKARKTAVEGLSPQKDDKVLIIGAGTGLDLELLPPEAQYTALDYTPAMLGRLQKRALRLGKQVACVTGDAARLPFDDHAFDRVTLHFVLEVLPDPETAMREAVRVMKPGGRLSLLDLFRKDERTPSWKMRMLEILTFWWFSGWNIFPEKLIHLLPLKIIYEKPCAWNGKVRLLILEKVG